MKKTLFSCTVLLAILIFSASCNKKETTATPTTLKTVKSSSHARVKGYPPGTALFRYFSYYWPCLADEKKDCIMLPDVIIKAPRKLMDELRAAAAGGPGTVGTMFHSPDFAELYNDLGDEGDLLQSGQYYIAISYEDATTVTVAAGTNANLQENANVEFAFQLTKE